MALGSTSAAMQRLVLMETLRLAGTGILLGVALSLWSGRVVASLLYGVTPQEPLIMAGAAATLLTAGIVAAWAPAYRASRIDPAMVLRNE
jgi:ABC-type antimicrobial peptide transport system permease subunit